MKNAFCKSRMPAGPLQGRPRRPSLRSWRSRPYCWLVLWLAIVLLAVLLLGTLVQLQWLQQGASQSGRATHAPAVAEPQHGAQAHADALVARPCFAEAVGAGWELLCHERGGPGGAAQCCCYNSSAWHHQPRQPHNLAALDSTAHFYRTPLRCLPAFLIVGSQKSGTTAAMAYLLLHPHFRPPRLKEAHFFDKGYRNGRQQLERPSPTALQRFVELFPAVNSSQAPRGLSGDATPSYMLSQRTMALARRALPSTPLIVLLRDPVDRAYSEYQMKVGHGRAKRRGRC